MRNNLRLKTIGPRAAFLIAELYERQKTIFSNKDVEKITGLSPKSARGLANRLIDRGLATRLKPGLFILVPTELGHERDYLGDPYVVAEEIVGGTSYYISHASAMDIHRMVTQPQLMVYATTTQAVRPRSVLGTEFRFVRCKPEHLFGIMDHWVTKTRKIRVSDLERTVIDGLRQSRYCGGFSEIAKGFWMRREDIDVKKLMEYALVMDIGAVYRRLGYLLELFGTEETGQLDLLRRKITSFYVLLDPMLPPEGKFIARWRLQLNVSPEEIKAIIRT
ncbi:MAG: type IV toxin-antitoxin system AbiEi family antitoxin domain-containing protein [Deltaproteobacteria bacterium]|nr:type IV toxin-antitoxin system AbiEi family antitoxin domain-containing protein [Deltaproteobacteria bacterium]